MDPRELATAARGVLGRFRQRLALRADAIAAALASEHRMVAWDREQLIGWAQAQLEALSRTRPTIGGAPARILERAAQPLEAIEAIWALLLRGRTVYFEREYGACSAVLELVTELAGELPRGALMIAREPIAAPSASTIGRAVIEPIVEAAVAPDDPTTWPRAGVRPAAPRIALVDDDADRELAAYVLARTCLRRSGLDPRGVKHAYVIGPIDRLRAHLERLWTGAQLGPADDPDAFSGPVDPAVRDAFVVSHAAWLAHPEIETWCGGGVLEHNESGVFLAPAVVAVRHAAPALPIVGPLLCVIECSEAEARAAIEAIDREDGALVQIGGRRVAYARDVRHVLGAVLVERLPPGLPEPRPV